MKNNKTRRDIDYPGSLPKPPRPESPPLARETRPAEAHVGVRAFRHALFSFWHTLAVLCKLAATGAASTVRPVLRHDSWIRSVAESLHDVGPTLTRWTADDSDPPAPPASLWVRIRRPISRGFLEPHWLLAQRGAHDAAPEPGESLTPPLTNPELSFTPEESDCWCQVIHLPAERQKTRRRVRT